MTLLARILALPIKGYRLIFSAWVGRSCRFDPTCSAYALTALERHGALKGSGSQCAASCAAILGASMALMMCQTRNNMRGRKNLSLLHAVFSTRLAPAVSNV